MQDALLAVKNDATRRNIPLRYMQWDDWAALSWDWPPAAAVFPAGASDWLGPDPWARAGEPKPFPLSLYIGHDDTRGCEICAKHNNCARCQAAREQYRWSANEAVSVDPRFFSSLMVNGSRVGMAHFEQDYLCASVAATSTDLETGSRWFAALDNAVAEAGIDWQVQYCPTLDKQYIIETT
jgi:hypothetical protein